VHQLAAFRPNVILVDYSLPGVSGESALAIAREHCPDTPVIVLSGEIGDEAAAGLIRQGATDFILKDRPARLVPVVQRAVAEAEQRSQLARLQAHLERAQRMESIGRRPDPACLPAARRPAACRSPTWPATHPANPTARAGMTHRDEPNMR
jgi:DNA-binding NtrC family response regulator